MTDRTKLERESGILWNEAEETATLWTVSGVTKRRMRRIMGEPTRVLGPCEEWAFPRSWVKLPRKPREVSEEQREKARANLEIARRK
jgi:hypothetical protein